MTSGQCIIRAWLHKIDSERCIHPALPRGLMITCDVSRSNILDAMGNHAMIYCWDNYAPQGTNPDKRTLTLNDNFDLFKTTRADVRMKTACGPMDDYMFEGAASLLLEVRDQKDVVRDNYVATKDSNTTTLQAIAYARGMPKASTSIPKIPFTPVKLSDRY